MKKMAIILVLCLLSGYLPAQGDKTSFWLTFEQLEDSLNVRPKPVFLYFHTDWCTYCRKMEAEVFTKPVVASLLSGEYYAVKFDAEFPDEIRFDGKVFSNKQLKTSRTPLHELAVLFNGNASDFAPPLMLVFDSAFFAKERINTYLDSKKLERVLRKYLENN
jgi:thioredoxin-related protein